MMHNDVARAWAAWLCRCNGQPEGSCAAEVLPFAPGMYTDSVERSV